MSAGLRLPRAAPNGLIAATLLSFLGTAGLFYVNIMPALIDGLRTGLGLTNKDAGLIGSANLYGAAAGALAASWLVAHWRWRPTAMTLLLTLVAFDGISMVERSATLLIVTRAAHGFAGGMLVGFAFAVIARTLRPERVFGALLIVQFGLGGLGVMYLPGLVPTYGPAVLFLALIAFSAITLMMLPFLDQYAVATPGGVRTQPGIQRGRLLSGALCLALASVSVFQAANMALFSFIFGLASHSGLDSGLASFTVGAATWMGVAGSIAVMVLSTRFGRVRPLLVALVLTVAGFWILHFSASVALFALANCGTSITWAFVLPYLLGMCAEFDSTGRAAALGGFASKVGLASGPLAGAFLLGDGDYGTLIDLSTAAIGLCALLALVPARMLDRRGR